MGASQKHFSNTIAKRLKQQFAKGPVYFSGPPDTYSGGLPIRYRDFFFLMQPFNDSLPLRSLNLRGSFHLEVRLQTCLPRRKKSPCPTDAFDLPFVWKTSLYCTKKRNGA